ncbi:hypothetical protein ILUMI_13908, partial [Ignelater luminosus]
METPNILNGRFYKIVSKCDNEVVSHCQNCPAKIQGSITSTGSFIMAFEVIDLIFIVSSHPSNSYIYILLLQRKHPDTFSKFEATEGKKQGIAEPSNFASTQLKVFENPQSVSTDLVNKLVINYIVEEMRPICTVEKSAFVKLVESLSGKKPCDRKTLRSRLEAAKSTVIGYIKKDFDKIAGVINEVHTFYDLKIDKISGTVTDNAKNFSKAFNVFSMSLSDTNVNNDNDNFAEFPELENCNEVNVETLTYFDEEATFPKDKYRQRPWMDACKLEECQLKASSTICSKHFSELDYNSTIVARRRLHKEAVPSLNINNKDEKMEVDSGPSYSRNQDEGIKQLPENTKSSLSPKTPRYVGDLRPDHFSTPRKAKRNLEFVKQVVTQQRKKCKILNEDKKKLEKQILSLKDLVEVLKQRRLLSDKASAAIMDSTPDSLKNILERQLVARNAKFTPELRAFALTLHYYSPWAYNFVREEFNNLLPHPDTLREWYMVIDGSPGFSKESFNALKMQVKQDKNVIINLVMDEMSIRELVEYSNGRYYGYVDLGMGSEHDGDHDNKDEAKSAFVFMGVSLGSYWKLPLGSITFDGAAVNIAMCNELGTQYQFPDLKPSFQFNNMEVHTFWDACHMVKLVRNTLGDRKILYDPNGNPIEWKYIESIEKLQAREGLRAGTKLTARHINFQNEKMKVSLVVQTLSRSVSSALLVCKELNIEG